MGQSVNAIKYTIGGPETTAGTAVARTAVIPIRGLPGLTSTIEKTADPAIVGSNMITGKYRMSGDVSGPLPLALRAVPGAGKLFNSLLGQESAPTQVAAAIKIRYTGSDASCKISASASGDTLDSDTGTFGSESGDSNFGTGGSIDLTSSATDTVGELVSTINGYSDYDCEKLFGGDAVDAAEILDITSKQAKSGWVVVYFGSAASGVYLHQWEVVLTNTERPTYSIQGDGLGDDFLWAGCVVDSLSMSGAMKAMIEAEASVLGMTETTSGVTASSVSLEDIDPLTFTDGSVTIGEIEYTYARNFALQFNNNHNADGYGMGSIYRQYQEKGIFAATGNIQVRMDSDAIAEKDNVDSTDLVAIFLQFQGPDDDELATDIPALLWVELPYCSIDGFEFPENSGVVDANIPFEAVDKKGSPYNHAVTVSMLSDDSAAY